VWLVFSCLPCAIEKDLLTALHPTGLFAGKTISSAKKTALKRSFFTPENFLSFPCSSRGESYAASLPSGRICASAGVSSLASVLQNKDQRSWQAETFLFFQASTANFNIVYTFIAYFRAPAGEKNLSTPVILLAACFKKVPIAGNPQ